MSEVLILKRASAIRSSGQWSDDDYDVLSEGEVVGRIYEDTTAGNPKLRWFWSILWSNVGTRRPVWNNGRAPTLDEAKAEFRRAWEAFTSHGQNDTRARFEIAVDGTLRAEYRDRAQGIEAAISLQASHPSAGVTVRDVLTGEMLVIIKRPGGDR